MEYLQCFERSELKYMLTREQFDWFMSAASGELVPDEYPEGSIRSLYFDTPESLLISRSCEQPEYKEKLRLRAYSQVESGETVFAELKKKYASVVYKRRTGLSEAEAMRWLAGETHRTSTQIEREIDAFTSQYKTLRPAALIFCHRLSFVLRSDKNVRITFDTDVLGRTSDLSLTSPEYGEKLCDGIIMEVKVPGAVPVRLAELLSAGGIYKTSFSKYGTLYRNEIAKREKSRAANF